MTAKIQQQTESPPLTNIEDPPGKWFFVVMYFLYHFVLFFAMSYLYTLVMFYDTKMNPDYMEPGVKAWSGNGLIIAVVILYILYFLIALHFTLRFSRHAFGVCLSTVNYTLLYLVLVINQNIDSSCERRELLTCYEETGDYNLDDTALLLANEIILYTVAGIFVLQIVYFFINFQSYRAEKYYFYKNGFKEFLATMSMYYVVSFMITLLPFLCMCGLGSSDGGSCSSTNLGNFAEGQTSLGLEDGTIEVV